MTLRLLRILVLLVLVPFALLPLYWMLVVSLKPAGSVLIGGSGWWPQQAVLDNYARLFHDPLAFQWILNTIFVIGCSLLIGLACSFCAAYALMHMRLPRRRIVGSILFGSYLLPQAILFLPLIRELAALHLLDSPVAWL